MDVKIIYPKHNILSNYIEYYYILRHSRVEGRTRYQCFPNSDSSISLIKNAKCTIFNQKTIIEEHDKNTISSFLITPFKKPMHIEYNGDILEISIVFKPLGINHFIESNLNIYDSGKFNDFIPYDNYLNEISQVLLESSNGAMIDRLENHLLLRLRNFQHPFLTHVLNRISMNIGINFSELSKELNISQKTLIAHFSKHINLKPGEFKRIIRFRSAFNKKVTLKKQTKLTEISNEAHFFDQAHMIHEFQSLSNLSPKKLLEMVTSSENGELNWVFQKR